MVTDEQVTSSGRIPPIPRSPFDWSERFVDFVGSCNEGVGPFIPPVQDLGSNRATLGTRPPFKLTHNPYLLQTFLSSLAQVLHRQASPSVEFTVFSFTLAFARSNFQISGTGCFQVREVPVILLCPPKTSVPP